MNIKELKEIIEIFENSSISELELERQGLKIRLKKVPETGAAAVEIEPERNFDARAEARPAGDDSEKADEQQQAVEITAPMVGTFYRMPSPDSEPFVEEGDIVNEGDVVCIIEAMKLMNEIKAEIRGKVVKVLVENGQAVEFNEPLFLIEAE